MPISNFNKFYKTAIPLSVIFSTIVFIMNAVTQGGKREGGNSKSGRISWHLSCIRELQRYNEVILLCIGFFFVVCVRTSRKPETVDVHLPPTYQIFTIF